MCHSYFHFLALTVLHFLWQNVKPKLLALPGHHYSTMSTRLETPRWQGALPSLQGILLPSGVHTESLNKLYFVQMDFFNHHWILGLDNKFHMKQNMEESIVSSTGQKWKPNWGQANNSRLLETSESGRFFKGRRFHFWYLIFLRDVLGSLILLIRNFIICAKV